MAREGSFRCPSGHIPLARIPPCPSWQVGEGGNPSLDAVRELRSAGQFRKGECVITDEMRQAWRAEQVVRAASLKRAKAAGVEAINSGAAVPQWASDRIKQSLEEEDWWNKSAAEGFSIGKHELATVIDSIDMIYFDGFLSPEREQAILAGAPPTNEERVVHRNVFLNAVFTRPQDFDSDLTYWQVFEVRGYRPGCYLLVASISGGQSGPSITEFEFFPDAKAALDWPRLDSVIDIDFLRWRRATKYQ